MRSTYPAVLAALVFTACADQSQTPLAPGNAQLSMGGNSPHGGGIPLSIAFNSRRAGDFPDIFLMHPNGASQTRLTFSPTTDALPDWSPNGRQIAFMSDRALGNFDIWVMNADGSSPVRLTTHPALDQFPRWSPNGKQIAFHTNRDGNFEVYVMNADGTGQTNLTNNPLPDRAPSWSPNGKEIVFERAGNIWVIDLASGEETQLTNVPQFEDGPTFSPNGKQIAFASFRDGFRSVFVMDADGGNPVNLTPQPAMSAVPWLNFAPVWSRNGKRIYFQASRPETAPDVEVFVMDADGGNLARLTFAPGVDGGVSVR